MVESMRHFRFPVYDDESGAKDKNFISPYRKRKEEKQITSDLFEENVTKIVDKDVDKRQALHSKNDVKAAIQDNFNYDLLRERVKKQTKQFSTKTPTAFNKPNEAQEKIAEKETTKENESVVKKEKSNVAETYKSFANEPVESIEDQNLSSEIEKIPLIKREMQSTREQMESAVPFHRKHKKG